MNNFIRAKKTCQECKWFMANVDLKTGSCLRYPPILLLVNNQNMAWGRPQTTVDGICGEHEQKGIK